MDTRHALLVALPMAVILVTVVHLSLADKTGAMSKAGACFLIALVLAFTLSTIRNYVSWQARWVKDRSVMANLAGLNSTADGISVFWVDDQSQIGTEEHCRFYEWAFIFKIVRGDESRIGLDQKYYTPDLLRSGLRYFNRRHNLYDFDPAGCQAILTIRRGFLSYSNTGLVARYLFYRFFHKDKLDEFLTGVTDVHVQSILAPGAVNCPTQ